MISAGLTHIHAQLIVQVEILKIAFIGRILTYAANAIVAKTIAFGVQEKILIEVGEQLFQF